MDPSLPLLPCESSVSVKKTLIEKKKKKRVIKQNLTPAWFNDFQVLEKLRSLIANPCKLGGMGIISPLEIANEEYINSYYTTRTQPHSIRGWNKRKKIRSNIQKKRTKNQQRTLSLLREKVSYMEIRLNGLAREQWSSSWLTVLPIKRLGFNLSCSDFKDAVRLRHGLPLKRFPSHCGCSKRTTRTIIQEKWICNSRHEDTMS